MDLHVLKSDAQQESFQTRGIAMAVKGGEARLLLAFPVEKAQEHSRELVRQGRVDQRVWREFVRDVTYQDTAWAESVQYVEVHCPRVCDVLRDAASDGQICRRQGSSFRNVTTDRLIVTAWRRRIELFL